MPAAQPIGIGAKVTVPTLPSATGVPTTTTPSTATSAGGAQAANLGPTSFQGLIEKLGKIITGGQTVPTPKVAIPSNISADLPSISDIQAGYEAAIAKQGQQETADVNALMAKAGLSDSTQRLGMLQDISQQGVIERGQLAMQLRDLGFNEKFQEAKLSLDAQEFNAKAALMTQRITFLMFYRLREWTLI